MKTKLLLLMFSFFAVAMTAQHDDYWTLQATGFSEASRGITDISIVDENIVWAVAYDGADTDNHIQEFTKTTDGGLTWTAGLIDIGSPGSGIAMISAISADVAWLVAYPNAGGQDQGVFKTTDGGLTWNKQATALYNQGASFINVVHFWNENIGFAQGDPVDGYFECYTTTDGGDNWVRVPQANIPDPIAADEYGTVNMIYVTGDTMWYTTNKGRIYRSYDFGNTFEVYQSPIESFNSTTSSGQIGFNNDTQGYLVNQEGLLWTSSDGGEVWNLVFPGGDGVVFPGDITAIPNTNVVITAGAGSLSGASFSDDAGLNFTTMCDTEQHLETDFLNGSTGWSGSFSVSSTEGGMFKYTGPDLGLSIADLEAKGFLAFPNPVQDVFKMSALENITNVSVHNVLGQEVYTSQPSALTHDIDMSAFPHGTYIVNITIGGVEGTTKVIK